MSEALPAKVSLDRARAAMQMRRFDEAEREARAAISADAASVDGYGLLAQALLASGRPKEALEPVECALRTAPASDWLHRVRSVALRGANRLDEALQEADEALRLAPDSALSHYVRAAALQAHYRVQEAKAEYLRSLEIDPDDASAHRAIGDMVTDLDVAEAEKHYRAALAIDPQNAVTLNNLGVALKRAGKTEDAALAFKSAVLLDPTLQVAKANVHSTVDGMLGNVVKTAAVGGGVGLWGLAKLGIVGSRAASLATSHSSTSATDSDTLIIAIAVVGLALVIFFAAKRAMEKNRKARAWDRLQKLDPQLVAIYQKVDADKKAGR